MRLRKRSNHGSGINKTEDKTRFLFVYLGRDKDGIGPGDKQNKISYHKTKQKGLVNL